MQRPTRVTLVAWTVIVFSVLGVLGTLVMIWSMGYLAHQASNNPDFANAVSQELARRAAAAHDPATAARLARINPQSLASMRGIGTVFAVLMGIFEVIWLVTGIGLLKAQAWARVVFVVMTVLSLLSVFAGGHQLPIAFAMFAVQAFGAWLLYSGPADPYFVEGGRASGPWR